jgi:two-component system, NtrC family, sensor histidine kinase AtoS
MKFGNNFFTKGASELEISQNEISLLLDDIPLPCIIINLKSKLIINLNGLTTELTKFGRKELIGLDIFSLMENFPSEKIVENKKYECLIKIRNQTTNLPIHFELRYLDQKENTALLKIRTNIINRENSTSFDEKIIDNMRRINQIIFLANESNLFSAIAAEALNIFSLSKVLIYVLDEEENLLKIINNQDEIFPNHLSVIELDRIKSIDYWSPGKRVLTELHRVGRKNNYPLVITTPMGLVKKGLMILVSSFGSIDMMRKQELESYIAWINQCLEIRCQFEKKTKTNNRLNRINLFLSKFLEHSNDCFILIDSDLKIIKINEQLQNLLKYSSYELIDQNFLEIIQSEIISDILLKNKRDEIIRLSSTEIYDRDGNEIPTNIKIIRINSSEFDGFMMVISDISEKKYFEKTINKVGDKAAIGEVIADFAHEVRNPINNISTGLQLMRKKFVGEESALDIVDRLQSDCVRMNDLMESILSFSRQEISNFKPFNCVELISRITNRFNNKFIKNKIIVNIHVKTQNTMVFGDRKAIDQVFTNLINNAVDAMEKIGGELTIKIQDNDNYSGMLEFVISDTGYGIPDDLKENIFDPFFTRKEKGTGLGLAITKRIIDSHDGKIKVDSSTSGTIFTILLKLAEKE